MQLEKIVTDWHTLYSSPSKINNLKNCVIYISYSNLQKLKRMINGIVNDSKLKDYEKEVELLNFDKIIDFIKRNNAEIESDYLETEELPFVSENNSFIVIVKEVRDIRKMNEDLYDITLSKEENETVYVALLEDAQILTIKDSFCYMIKEYEIPVFYLNIKDKD